MPWILLLPSWNMIIKKIHLKSVSWASWSIIAEKFRAHLHQVKWKLCLLHEETAKLCQLLGIFHLHHESQTNLRGIFRSLTWCFGWILSTPGDDSLHRFTQPKSKIKEFLSHFCQKVPASPPCRSGILQASCLVAPRLDCRVNLKTNRKWRQDFILFSLIQLR